MYLPSRIEDGSFPNAACSAEADVAFAPVLMADSDCIADALVLGIVLPFWLVLPLSMLIWLL